jgi:cytochrome c oxidase assembly factor CtaG
MAALGAATASPLAHLDDAHLTGHMLQHLLIMTVAAPLLLLAEPGALLQRSFPRLRALEQLPTPHPLVCWFAGTLVVLIWHVPPIFAFGMRWHGLEHATFFVAGLLFWVPVLRPWPTRTRWPAWSIPLYLFFATLPCDGLSAFLTFSGRVVYSQYGTAHCAAMSSGALEDQQRAGALMWFWVTIAYLVPAVLVTVELLSPRRVPNIRLQGQLLSRAAQDSGRHG